MEDTKNENKNEIRDSLTKLPQLVKTIQLAEENHEKMFNILAQNIQQRLEVQITPEETGRIVNTVIDGIRRTRCMLPDSSELCRSIAAEIAENVSEEAKNAVIEAIKAVKVDTTVTHCYMPSYEARNYADKVLKKRFSIISVICGIAILYGAIGTYSFLNSELYLGSRYAKICNSELTSKKEKMNLIDDTFVISRIPSFAKDDKSKLKAYLKEAEGVLENRRIEQQNSK